MLVQEMSATTYVRIIIHMDRQLRASVISGLRRRRERAAASLRSRSLVTVVISPLISRQIYLCYASASYNGDQVCVLLQFPFVLYSTLEQ